MSEWQQVTLHEVCSFKRGLSYSGSDVQEESPSGIPFITIKNFHKGGGFNFSGFKKYLGRNYANFTVNPGELLIANTDVTRNADIIGSAIIAPEVGSDIAFSMDVTHLDVDKNKASPAFVFYRLLLDDAREHMKGASAGSTVLHLNLKQASAFSFKIPTKNEQKAIARVLDTLDTQIQKTEALIAKLEKVKEGLLHDLLTRGIDENGRLRPSPEQAPELYQESSLGLIPRDWALVSLGDCITSMDQGWSPACEDSPSADDEWGVLKTSSVTWEGYTASENKKLPENLSPLPRYEVFEGDVLITRAGPKSRVGVVCYVYGTPPNIMISDKLYRLRFLEGCVPEFFSLQLSHRSIQSQISRTVSGMADSQTNISQHTINSLIACLPQKHEQETICNSIRSISLWVGKEKSSLVELRTLKAGLMDDLLTGRVRVTSLLEQAEATTPA